MSISDPRLFGHNPDTGITEWFHYDEVDGGFVIESQQDISGLIEVNKAQYNASEKSTRYGEWTEVATIPNVVLMQLSTQGIVSPTGRILDDKKYRAWLNSSENRCFRTRAGRV